MSDIVERLRKRPAGDLAHAFERKEAADEIERQREELADVRADAARLRAALQEIIAGNGEKSDVDIARRALEPKT